MSRTHHIFAVFAIGGALAGGALAACAARPGSAGEMPPTAPRPVPLDPSGAPAPAGLGNHELGHGLGPTTTGSGGMTDDAGNPTNPTSPGPVSAARRTGVPTYVAYLDDPAPTGVVGSQVPRDAGASPDGYEPPMQPLPDGGVPVDSRLEPREHAESADPSGAP